MSRQKDSASGIYEVNYCKNHHILDEWATKETKLNLNAIYQVLYNDGHKIGENILGFEKTSWFLLILTDGSMTCCLEMQIDNDMKIIANNIMGAEYVNEYLKMLMYVDKREWVDFFECMIVREKGAFFLGCSHC